MFICFDCGKTVGNPVSVRRPMGHVADNPYPGVAYVHRAGNGCHKGWTSQEVYNGQKKEEAK